MHRKQFLLTKEKISLPSLIEKQKIDNYHLYAGKDCEYSCLKDKTKEIHLLGNMYDWENPNFSNQNILEILSYSNYIDDIIEITNNYCGEFVIIIKLNNEIFIFNDATGQKEVYYDSNYYSFGTQPKLLGLSLNLLEHTDAGAIEFYQSKIFMQKRLFVGNSTDKKNIFHLLPNHCIKVSNKSVERFFPKQRINIQPLKIAEKCAIMLKGFISAIAERNEIKMAVTGGYDSRVLFLASLNVKCKYFVSKHKNMKNDHHDIAIPKHLTALYKKQFNIEEDDENILSKNDSDYLNDIDFPRFLNISKKDNEYTYINGNISEIARNYFGYYKNATAKDLCFLMGYDSMNFAIKFYHNWLKNKKMFHKNGYHYLDMFYWEEKMGNWAAKSKTESYALGRDVVSPFNSRNLLILLLSTKRVERDSHFNKLYNVIISKLSNEEKKVISIPINPSRKQALIRLMKRLKIYNLYKYIGLKSRRLKV